MQNTKADIRLCCMELMQTLMSGGGSLTKLLPLAQERVKESERAQLQAWCYGMARYADELSGLVDQLLKKPLKRKDLDIYILMQLGVFQLRHTSIAPHAAVDETVKVLKRIKKVWAKGLVNAVLRNYQRSCVTLESQLNTAQQLSHPEWLLKRFQQDWPDSWQKICHANNQQGPMTLRVNRLKTTRDSYLQKLNNQGVKSVAATSTPDAIILEQPVAVSVLPGFSKGLVSVQDAAAQLAVEKLLSFSSPGARLLDACAAPGGKTAHALETKHFRQVTALDIDPVRCMRIEETLQRLELSSHAVVMQADAASTDNWWDGELFDAILLDAPCSGSGVIRRHPDIKLLRRPTDISTLVNTQAQLLNRLWPLLSDNGVLLYATCSVLKDENEHQIDRFLQQTTNAKLLAPIEQIMPGEYLMDGFFYAALKKHGGQ